MVVPLKNLCFQALELAKASSFANYVLFHSDNHLSSEIIPHDINEMLEYLLKNLFLWVQK